jgi:hypothetical protein
MKICHVTFSCNRLRYLFPTMNSWKNWDFGNHEVHRILIDDYPRTRNDRIFLMIRDIYGIDELRFNEENKGLSVTWTEFFQLLKDRDYDYILHQEDDVILNQPIKVDDMIELLESDPKIASVVLKRQPWYSWDPDLKISETDINFNNKYLYEKNTQTFPIITSLYKREIINAKFKEYWGFTLNEGMIMVFLNELHGMYSATMKNLDGSNIIEHIGEEFTGKRILENEPRWEIFKQYDPNKVYCSRTGSLIE